MTTTTAGRVLPAVVAACLLGLAGPALAHSEGRTPYRYVVAPPEVESEGPAEPGVSVQPFGQPTFAGTTDNQLQLTLPAGVLPALPGQSGVRVELLQLDPATLPALPAGLEPEGNAYRVGLSYVPSTSPVPALAGPASLGMSAPAAPTGVYRLAGSVWEPVEFVANAGDEGFSSVVPLTGPATFLQAYDPASAKPGSASASPPVSAASAQPASPAPAAAARPPGDDSRPVLPRLAGGLGIGLALLALGALVLRRRSSPQE